MALKQINNVTAHATMIREFDYELIWIPERNHIPGTTIELRAHNMKSFMHWKFVKASMPDADVTFRWKSNPTVTEKWNNKERVYLKAWLQYGARKGQEYKIKISFIPPYFAGVDLYLNVWYHNPIGAGSFGNREETIEHESASVCHLPVIAGPIERLSVYSRPFPNNKGKVRTAIVPEDRFGNPGELVKKAKATLHWNGKQIKKDIRKTTIVDLDQPKPIGRLQVDIPLQDLDLSDNIANGTINGKNVTVTGNPVWKDAVDGLKLAFGEFHWHTDFSGDGQRPIEDAIRFAKDDLNCDFTAPGDHNPQGENWTKTVEALEKFNKPGDFATFFGWENGSSHGHENYYFTDPNHPMICNGSAGVVGNGPTDSNREKARKEKDFIGIPHHTNAVSEVRHDDDTPYWYPYPWDQQEDYIRLVEIMQGRGNQERNNYTDSWRGWYGNQSSVQDALAKGFKLGFTGGTDNHSGYPGRALVPHEANFVHDPKSVILTGVWATDNERQAIYDGLYARHTCAYWDSRAIIVFKINNAWSGDEISVAKGKSLKASIKISAEAPFQSLEIISEGQTVWASSFDQLDIDVNVDLGKVKKSGYYYLRGLLRNKAIIYASPVFVTAT